jgi:hypothetical protein
VQDEPAEDAACGPDVGREDLPREGLEFELRKRLERREEEGGRTRM